MENEIRERAGKITPTRYARLLHALAHRTRRMTVVLEDVFQPHNAAALLRSCDAFGIQEAHLIENKYKTRLSKNVDMGTSKWMDVFHHTSPEARLCRVGEPKDQKVSETANANTRKVLRSLKEKGYSLVASTLRDGAMGIDDIPVDRPIALLVGTEFMGLSDAAHEMSDFQFSMPMLGFAQSFNLSVFGALCIANLSARMRALGDDWKMTEPEKQALLLSWLKRKDYSQ